MWKLYAGKEHGQIWLHNELRKHFKNYSTYFDEIEEEGIKYLVISIFKSSKVSLDFKIPTYKINDIEKIFNCEVYVKAIKDIFDTMED